MSRKTKSPAVAVGIAACAFALTASGEIQLFPAGKFRATDGRPKDAPHWYIDAALAEAIIAQVSALANSLVIDYEHQSLLAAKNGQPAPAAGWFKTLEWRDDGLYAVGVEWTARAATMIDAKEYLYISPVFSYDKKTGAIQAIFNAALTNNPALDGMDEVAVQAAAFQLFLNPIEKGLKMNYEELLSNLRWLLNLPALATPEEVAAELQKAVELIQAGNPEAAAAGFSLPALLAAKDTELVALRAAEPDPAKYVPIATINELQSQVAALTSQINEQQVSDLVDVALSDGRLLPTMEAWARGLGGKDLTALKGYLDTAQPIAALTQTQTRGKEPGGNELDRNDAQAISEAATRYQADQAALGRAINIYQAVNHVTK